MVHVRENDLGLRWYWCRRSGCFGELFRREVSCWWLGYWRGFTVCGCTLRCIVWAFWWKRTEENCQVPIWTCWVKVFDTSKWSYRRVGVGCVFRTQIRGWRETIEWVKQSVFVVKQASSKSQWLTLKTFITIIFLFLGLQVGCSCAGPCWLVAAGVQVYSACFFLLLRPALTQAVFFLIWVQGSKLLKLLLVSCPLTFHLPNEVSQQSSKSRGLWLGWGRKNWKQ